MKKALSAIVVLALASQFGCAAVQHRNLEVQVQMQQTVFIEPDVLDGRPIYVRVTNQTGKNDLNFDSLVTQKLIAKGYKVTKNSKEAGLRILANFKFLDKAQAGMTKEGAVAGGVGGALIGGAVANSAGGALLSGLGGASIGALAGTMVTVDTWYGIVDVQIEEPLQKAVTRRTTSTSKQARNSSSKQGHNDTRGSDSSSGSQGTGEASSMSYDETVKHKKNQTRVVAEAKQTNINVAEATKQIQEQLADSIANFL